MAGPAGPDPRELIAEIRDWTRNLCTRTRSTYQSIRAADALEDALARIAALEAENARLYEGWPTLSGTGAVFLVGDRWHFNEFPTRTNDGFGTKREAVQAHLGLDAPAGGGE